jgi:phosphatidylinositol 3-kinase
LYLLQLVQALRFENGVESRKKRKMAEEDDSGLSQFLIDRSVANPLLGTSFHWYLMIECDSRSPVGKAYAKVAFRFMQKLSEVSPCCVAIADM